ncbi:NAD(P)/FAD-dependent oxidoreductase [Rhizosaccharibacter radicis]|uniref:NAD(P)/FAD-dependent oxidoreductase n=1 Tax=Rhizosaccharibacter radicis TaxID=2782605 RepID=A0ABT1VXD4_9PROT|nr:NAD(P)/FAD-dependent oxidoreductase [Acetobacteraceae bacterium KSS12]
MKTDIVVIGAGAAGLMAAIAAGRRGRRVLVLDHADKAGAKILISGGGRCNFTNTGCVPERFLSGNRHFARSALARYTPADFLALVQKHRIAWHEKTLGQLFCDNSARDIVSMLVGEAEAAGTTIRLRTRVGEVSRPDRFRIDTDAGPVEAEALVVATGGLSIPRMGATGLAFRIAERFGVPVAPTRPGLVPLTFAEPEAARLRALAGVSLDTEAAIGRVRFREASLFTHRGLSGPAILQISSYWDGVGPVELDLLPGRDAREVLRSRRRGRGKAALATILGELLPQRLAQDIAGGIVAEAGPAAMGPVGGLPDRVLDRVAASLNGWSLRPSGTEGYAKAEVMVGGIDTRALSSQTMAARSVPGLFFVGEAVDVTGWLGGYNFQWAWSSGWAAGQAA